jgi:hypothetical protein
MAEPSVLRRKYYDILYVSGDFPLLELLAEDHPDFEVRPAEDDVEGIAGRLNDLLLAMPEDDAQLNPAERLRIADRTLRHGRVGGIVSGENLDLLQQLLAPAALGDSDDDRAERARGAIEVLNRMYAESNPPSLRQAIFAMTPDDRAAFLANFGEGTVAAATRLCAAEPVQVDDGPEAIRITTSYESSRAVNEFIFPGNPTNWPTCNPFFQSVEVIDGGYSRAPDELKGKPGVPDEGRLELNQVLGDPGHGGARARYEEVVDFGYLTVSTHLDMVHYVSPAGGETHRPYGDVVDENPNAIATGMSFEFADGGDQIIDVDHGYLRVRRDGNRTIVDASKTVRFAKWIPNEQSAAACLLGWLDSVEMMNQCRGP